MHIKYDPQPWNNKFIVRLEEGSELISHRELALDADKETIERVSKELISEQIAKEAEFKKINEEEKAKVEAVQVVLDSCKSTLTVESLEVKVEKPVKIEKVKVEADVKLEEAAEVKEIKQEPIIKI